MSALEPTGLVEATGLGAEAGPVGGFAPRLPAKRMRLISSAAALPGEKRRQHDVWICLSDKKAELFQRLNFIAQVRQRLADFAEPARSRLCAEL